MTNFSLSDDPSMDSEFHRGDYIRVAGDPNLYCIDRVGRTGYAVHDQAGITHQLNDIDPDDMTQEQNVSLWKVDDVSMSLHTIFLGLFEASTEEEVIQFMVRDSIRIDPRYPRTADKLRATQEDSILIDGRWMPRSDRYHEEHTDEISGS